MHPKWVNDWRDQVSREDVNFKGETKAKQFYLQGNTITFESFKVALSFTQYHHTDKNLLHDFTSGETNKAKENDDEVSVMFIISVQNYNGFKCFRLNGEKYSAYPQEKEVILLDGTQVAVMNVEEVQIDNDAEDFEHLKGKSLVIIHLFAVC